MAGIANLKRIGQHLCWTIALVVISWSAMHSGVARAETSNEVTQNGEQGANGKKLATIDPKTFVPKSLVFTADGQHAIWLIRSNDQNQVVLDGTPGPKFDGTYQPPVVLSPDGRHVAYLVENKGDKSLSVISDTSVGPPFDRILQGTLLFSSDSRHIAYAGARQGKYRVVLDGRPSPDYELVGHLSFSPDGQRFAYAAQLDKRRFVVVDGVRGPLFDDVYPSGFSPDSRHIVYYATQGKKQRIMVDDHPGSEYDAIGPVQFHPVRGAETPSIGYIALLGRTLIEVTQPLSK
jgi:WD40 repeat protein